MSLARIKTALDGIQDLSQHSLATETMSGIEPLPSSSNTSPAESPQDAISKTCQQAALRMDNLFSPVGGEKHEPDVVSVLAGSGTLVDGAGNLKSVSEPTTVEKEWRVTQQSRGFSESKNHYDYNQRTKTGAHIATTSETVFNRALFAKGSHQSGGSGRDISKSAAVSYPGLTTKGSKKLASVEKTSSSTYRYDAQSDRMNIEQELSREAPDLYSPDSMPPHYHDKGLTASSMSKTSQGHEDGGSAPGILSSRQQPSASSPKIEIYSPQEGSYAKNYQTREAIPPEFAEIESLRQNLSNMLTSPGVSQDESLSELLMSNKEHNERDSMDTVKTDSLLGSQVFQGISPSSLRPGSDSGLASYQPSHVTSSQRSGVSVNENSISKENRVLREGLERERCRRRHCEDQIATLQGRILETQQLLAVAQSTEKKKDNMIAQLDKTMAKVASSLKQRERDKVELVGKLKSANDALLEEIEKQKAVIRDQNQELRDLKQNCEEFKRSERAFREELKQHQAENAKRWEEAQQMAQLTNKQMESMGEDCLKAERQLKQVQGTLASEREEWKQKETELEQRISSIEMEQIASLDEMQRLLQEEKRTVEELNKDLTKMRREADDTRKEKEKATREKEKLSLELSVETARWEAKLEKQEAEIKTREETKAAERIEKMRREAEEMEELLRDGQRKQVSEMSERHMEELRIQKDVHQREMMKREQRWNDKQQQYQTRLAECQQEIIKLSTKLEKVQHQRFSVVSKLQHFLQSQCNEAVMMVSSLDSPQAPAHNQQVTNQLMYTPPSVKGHTGHGLLKESNTDGHYSSMKVDHAEQIRQAQEAARQAIQRLYQTRTTQGEDAEGEEPSHEGSFYPLDTAPSTPSISEMSQSTVYQDIDTSHAAQQHSANASLTQQHNVSASLAQQYDIKALLAQQENIKALLAQKQGIDASLPQHNISASSVQHFNTSHTAHPRSINGPQLPLAHQPDFASSLPPHMHNQPIPLLSNGPNGINHSAFNAMGNNGSGMGRGKAALDQQSSRDNETKGALGGGQSGWMDESDNGIFLEMIAADNTKLEQDIVGWMSQHNSTLTSSPSKDSPSPDVNIHHPGQGLTIPQVTSPVKGHLSQVKGHNVSQLSTGPLDILDSPASSTQGDWREIALQKYITKLLDQSPGSTQPVNPPKLQSVTGKSAIEKERIPTGLSQAITDNLPPRNKGTAPGSHDYRPPSRTDGGRGASAKTSKGLMSKDKKPTGPLLTASKASTNKPRSTTSGNQDNNVKQNKPTQKSKVWR